MNGPVNVPGASAADLAKVKKIADDAATAAGEAKTAAANNITKAKTATLTISGWAVGSDGRYAQTVAVAGVTTDTTKAIYVDVALDGSDLDADAAVLAAWAGPAANNVTQGSGTLTFYSYDIPAVNIPLNVGVAA